MGNDGKGSNLETIRGQCLIAMSHEPKTTAKSNEALTSANSLSLPSLSVTSVSLGED
jgi:hypothetical protein